MKIGARTVKTGLVVTLTVLLVNLLEAKIGAESYNIAGIAAITAIISMQPSIKGSLQTFRNRIIATFIGAIIAFVLALTLGLNAFYLGLGSIAIILICLQLKLNESIRFALVTLVALGTISSFDVMQIVYRVSGILIGLTVSTGLNIVFLPPDYTEDLKSKINELRIKFECLYSSVISDILRDKNVEKDIIKNKRQMIRDELDDVRDIFSLLMDDVFLTRDNRSKKKLFLKKYRRSINAIQSNLERLTALHRSIIFMPEGPQYHEIRQDLHGYLRYLLTVHKHIYNNIALNEEYQKVKGCIDREKMREKIMELIKADNRECIFEFYNVYSEALRINEKLEQLIIEFDLAS
ncbi:MAG: hypothetical protein GX878_03040 [Firmicutes bacterium]|nr:hypothetical protein [Bacillota bacterium]